MPKVPTTIYLKFIFRSTSLFDKEKDFIKVGFDLFLKLVFNIHFSNFRLIWKIFTLYHIGRIFYDIFIMPTKNCSSSSERVFPSKQKWKKCFYAKISEFRSTNILIFHLIFFVTSLAYYYKLFGNYETSNHHSLVSFFVRNFYWLTIFILWLMKSLLSILNYTSNVKDEQNDTNSI